MLVPKINARLSLLSLGIGVPEKSSKLFEESLTKIDFTKPRTLVDIRKDWLRKLYPEKDIFTKTK